MKQILNKLFEQQRLSKSEAKNVLIRVKLWYNYTIKIN